MTEYLTNLFSALTPLWEMSLTAAFAAAVVLVLRLILKRRAPRQVVCLLWLIVFARLLLPFSLESPVSLVPQALTEQPAPAVSQPADTPAQDQVPTPAVPTASAGASVPAVSAPPSASAPISSAEPVEHVDVQAPPVTVSAVPYGAVLAGVWLVGAAAMLLYGILSYVRLRRRVFDAVRAEDGAWEHPAVRSPFILGLFRPKIYLPAGLSGPARQFILCHERAHLKRLDHIVKPVCWLALALHWFNPMAWAAFLLMSRDIEVACDQAVLRQLGEGVKADYSATLLSLATGGKFPAPCPLAFGEGDAKSRIKSVLSYKKPTLWIIVAAVAVAVIAAVCLLTDPKAPAAEDPEPSASPSAQPSPSPSVQPGEAPAAQPDHSPLILRHLAGEELELDLDGDGVAERLSVVCLEVGGGNFYDVLTVRGADGETVATLDTYMGIDGSTPVYPDLGTPVLAPDPASGTVLVEYAGLSVQVPVEEDFFTASGQPVLAFTPSSDHSLIWNDGVLYLRSTGHIALSDAEAYPATGQRQFTPVECLYRLDYEPSSGLFSAVPVSLSPGCDQLSFFPAELVGFSSAPYQESELTLLGMDAASGTRLYADSRGLVSVLSSGRMGYVYINGELLNLNAAGRYGAENLYASLLYCGTDPNGYWQVTVELESDTQLLVTAFLYWYEPEQAWSTNLPGITVTPVTLQEGSTYYYTGFELDTPVGSRSFTGAHVDGQPTLTYCSDLTGDGVGDYIVMLCPGNGTGPVKHDLHIFDGVTLEKYDASGVWRVIPEAVEFTSDESNYYIAAPNFTTAVSKARVQAQVAPLNTMFDTMEFSGEICWLSVEGGKLCISYACIVGDYWTSYGTLRAELAVVNGALAAQRYYYIAPDGTVTDGTHTVEVSLDYSYSGGVLGPVEQLAEPFVLQITVPSQFQPVAGIGELAEVNDAGKIVGTGPAFALVRVSRDYVLDESVGQTQQLITSGGVYSEHVGENAEISRYTTSAGYDAVVYEYHYGDETGLPRSLYAFVRVAPEYVLHVSLGNAETIPTRYEFLDSILVGNQPGKLVTMDTLPTDPEEYYLVAQLPEENIWLYSRNYGQETLLVRNGAQQSYDYTAHIHYMNLPRMVMLDTNCVGVISQVGAGTGANEEELVVYDLRDPSNWRDYRYDGSFVAEAFNRNNTLVYDADTNSLAMTYGGVTYHTGTLAEELARSLGLEDGFTGAACADRSIVLYQFNGDDTVQVTMDTCIAGYPVSIGVTGFELTWAVRFTGNGFETVPGSFEII